MWWARLVSNQRPLACKLPAALRWRAHAAMPQRFRAVTSSPGTRSSAHVATAVATDPLSQRTIACRAQHAQDEQEDADRNHHVAGDVKGQWVQNVPSCDEPSRVDAWTLTGLMSPGSSGGHEA